MDHEYSPGVGKQRYPLAAGVCRRRLGADRGGQVDRGRRPEVAYAFVTQAM